MLPLFGDIASIIGLVVTLWVARSLWQLKKYYVFKGRHPEITRDIRKYSSELSQLFNSNNMDGDAAEVTLRRCQSTLKALRRLIPQDYIKAVKEAEKAVSICITKKMTFDRNSVRNAYNLLITVESDLGNIKKDEQWSTKP